ncbi:MAG TPA: hypothetical protein VFR91_02020 [Dyella sp.]|nr:hypothetical protein [Dyella sp.]
MEVSARNPLPGICSGILVSWVVLRAIGATAAVARPLGVSSDLWQAVVVFGLGAFVPALVIYLTTLLVFRPSALASLNGFCVAVIAGMAWFAELTFAGSALAAVILAALAATFLARLRSGAPSTRALHDPA